ncbi:MAG: CBS domain-containing protein [Nitrosopumilaceae archaeon]|nr:CBS domain-containing protein [Nitrosopumilaceae archaeon]NIU00904.1 CBS domain-containing protein [Nitrosopumilaceae archaeon]NIU87357.1 CBS domain-containing protein [Nitrosopumilaceae archaeon]NIV65885.1 CBS domain-containing protein [Nitrosopumilaceae archaeon]NIX61506.1 CBS domain-containing protein [Nitrosopumilaceae archaeon]
MWTATAMLINYLESFTDSLVVTNENHEPIGVIGGIEIIKNVFENPTWDFFENQTIDTIMDNDLLIVDAKTTYKEVLKKWNETRRAFCILPNSYCGYSAISARKILEIGAYNKTKLSIKDLPAKDVVTFNLDDSIGKIMNSMMTHHTRKLVLRHTSKFISDRIIIEKIARDLDYLRDTSNFLDMKAKSVNRLEEAKSISEDMNLTDLSRLLLSMIHPYVISSNQVISPWDICKALGKI